MSGKHCRSTRPFGTGWWSQRRLATIAPCSMAWRSRPFSRSPSVDAVPDVADGVVLAIDNVIAIISRGRHADMVGRYANERAHLEAIERKRRGRGDHAMLLVRALDNGLAETLTTARVQHQAEAVVARRRGGTAILRERHAAGIDHHPVLRRAPVDHARQHSHGHVLRRAGADLHLK